MLRKYILATCLLSWTSSAFCLVNVEAFYGKRWYKKLLGRGSEVSVGLNFDPIPFVPLSLGASYSVIELEKGNLDAASEAEIRKVDLNVKAWAPFVPVLTPYVRGTYIASSQLKIVHEDNARNIDTKLRGYSVGFGVDYRIVPMVHAELELKQSWETVESFAGQNQDLISNSLLIGLLVGI